VASLAGHAASRFDTLGTTTWKGNVVAVSPGAERIVSLARVSTTSPVIRDVRRVETLTDWQRQHLFHFTPDVFGDLPLGLQWEPKTPFFLVYEADALVANAGVVARTVDVAGEAVKVIGIGAVVCRPEARGRGHATAAVAAALEHGSAATGDEYGLLFCLQRLVRIYARKGWELLRVPVLIDQPTGTVRAPLEVMIKPLTARPWPGGEVRLNGRPW
jgi:hypothetical protein